MALSPRTSFSYISMLIAARGVSSAGELDFATAIADALTQANIGLGRAAGRPS